MSPVTVLVKWFLSIMSFFFFNDTATTEIYTLSLHDALPISTAAREAGRVVSRGRQLPPAMSARWRVTPGRHRDRKSTRLNSSHVRISYAVFCLKKKIKESLATVVTPSGPPLDYDNARCTPRS